MSLAIHPNPTYIGAIEHADRLAEIYGGAAKALWELLERDWEFDGPKCQQRWRTKVVNELSRRAGV